MPSSEETIQEDILAFLNDAIAQPVIEQSIPDSQTVLRNSAGDIQPYVAVQFGDSQQQGSRAMAGPLGDDYVIPIYTQAIGPTPKIARQIANRVRAALLGAAFEWSGTLRKRPGGGMFPITSSNGATECYQTPASFGLMYQFKVDASS
jgi:hypothetical protein